jgi:argininosuccinate lyase
MTSEPSTHDGSLWGGRFSEGPSPEMAKLSQSTHFDWRLVPYDLDATRAHASELARQGYLSAEQLSTLTSALDSLREDFLEGRLTPSADDEDVHGALERELISRVGADTGGAVRAGRSRNDQIATFVRMYLRDQTHSIRHMLIEVVRILILRSEEAGVHYMPGRTHFQHAQPVLVAHHLLAHAWPLLRNIQRLDDWAVRNDASPYGSGALAGGGLGLDAQAIAQELGFASVAPNSLDATASRDVVAEWAYIAAQIGIDLSRIAEELIVFATAEFGYISLHDSYSTGSSMMPQKKNPDIAELARGKAGRLVGNLTGLLTTLKALPLAYNRDLQEDKEPLFDSVDTLVMVLPAMAGMLATITFHYERMEQLATAGYSLATDVADWLVVRDVPFRDAHEIAGALVAACEAKGVDLDGLSAEEYLAVSPHLDPSVKDILTAEESIAKKNGPAGTAAQSVDAQREALRAALNSLETR